MNCRQSAAAILVATGVLLGMGEEMRAESPPSPVTIVTLGDSITRGVRDGVAGDETFAALIERSLRDQGSDCRVVNVGIGGERSDQALARLDDVIGHRPRFVTIMYGTNDSYVDRGQTDSRLTVEEYRINLHEIVSRLLRRGIEPVLMTEPRWAANAAANGVGEHPNLRLEPFVEACRAVARELDVRLVDHFAHWTQAEQSGQNLSDWTTDACHPNPAGHHELANLMLPVLTGVITPTFQPAGFRIERETVLKHDDGKFLWFHPRVAAIPSETGNPAVVMTLQKHLYTSDHYSGLSVMRTDDLGGTWSGPEARTELDWVRDGIVDVAVADVTPGWHPQTGKLIAVGAQVRYSATGEQLEDQPRANQTAYAVYDPKANEWSPWRRLEMPAGDEFNMARSACAQFVVEADGSVLLPYYIGPSTAVPFRTTVVRCTFDGNELKYAEHGNVLSLDVARGLYEPSLIRFDGRYYLTIRNDEQGYVTVSDDGLHFRPIKLWQFDDGTELGSYNTQQHWVVQNGGLFLVYTRRGANNDHIMRHRAPLFIAQVDPQQLHVVRDTEQVLLPERGATLGNSGAAAITPNESWVTVAEGIWTDDARQRGAEGAVLLARVISAELQPPATPVATASLVSGSEPVHIVCFGDSVTGLYYHTGGRRAYADLLGTALQRLCPRADVTTLNAGISGHTTRDALARIDTDVLAKRPSLVTVMFGLNDMTRVPLDEYRANLLTMIEKVRDAGAEVVLCTPNSVITTTGRPVEKLEQYCEVVRALAAEQGAALCDCYQVYETLRERDSLAWRLLMSDEIHPNHDGHKLIAESIAHTITGRETSLTDVAPLRPAVPHTFAKLRRGEPVKVLAMPPFDQSAAQAIERIAPQVPVDVVSWPAAALSLAQLEQDTKTRVRELKPDLVVIAVPRSATAASTEEFIRSSAWIMNWSLSFGRQEWDVVVVHPDVTDPQDSEDTFDDLTRRLVNAQDLTLIDRPPGDAADAAAVISDWLEHQWRFDPAQ
ncbi:MAG: GDSL-type esterase/lipase family protein [Planctomycetaceae bacterium]